MHADPQEGHPEPGHDHVRALLDDLEQQADGLRMAERDLEVAELGRAELAQLTLESCLRGSVGRELRVGVLGAGQVTGQLTRVGDGWLWLEAGTTTWCVTASGLAGVRGLVGRPSAATGVADRLGLGSALRAVAERGAPVVLHRLDATTAAGTLVRVGADFVSLGTGEGVGRHEEVVPFAALAAVRCSG